MDQEIADQIDAMKDMRLKEEFIARARHRLRNDYGELEDIHEHAYCVETNLAGRLLDPYGDYETLHMQRRLYAVSAIFNAWVRKHVEGRTIVGPDDPLSKSAEKGIVVCPYAPTDENLSMWLRQELSELLDHYNGKSRKLEKIRLTGVCVTAEKKPCQMFAAGNA